MVLNNKRRRGAVTLVGLVICSAVIGALAIPLSTCILQAPAAQGQMADVVNKAPSDPPPVVAAVDGGPSNGWIGTLSDGRKAQLIQISRRLNGKVIAWRPDGTLLPGEGIERTSRSVQHPADLQFVVRVPTKNASDDVRGGLGSPSGGGDVGRSYHGNGVWPMKDGHRSVVSLILVPTLPASGTADFSWTIADYPYTGTVVNQANPGVITKLAFQRDSGKNIKWPTEELSAAIKAGRPLMRVDFALPRSIEDYRLRPLDENGKPVDSLFNGGTYEINQYWFDAVITDKTDFLFEVRPSLGIEFHKIALRPKN